MKLWRQFLPLFRPPLGAIRPWRRFPPKRRRPRHRHYNGRVSTSFSRGLTSRLRPNRRGFQRQFHKPQGQGAVMAFHGTKSVAAATSILRDGWEIGAGQAIGSGVYLTTRLEVAKLYASSAGCYVKCSVHLGRCLEWNVEAQARWRSWCQHHNILADGSGIAAFARKHGYDTIRQSDTIVVPAILCANPSAWRRKFGNIRILSIHQANDDRRIQV